MFFNIFEYLINSEAIRYLFFGGLTTVVSILSYEVCKRVLIKKSGKSTPLIINIATIFSWVLAVSFAFITNKLFVFNSSSFEAMIVFKEATKFVCARVLSLLFEVIFMNITTVLLKLNDSFCKVAAQFVIVVLNYIFSKLFIFK